MDSKCKSISRRAVLRNTMLGMTTALAGSLMACAGGSVRNQPVWLSMTQKELDDAYSQFIYAPNIGQVIERWGSNSELARGRIGQPLNFAYGSGAVESLDVYPTNQPNAPIHIFIHGGAWQQGTAESYAFPAELFVNAGVHYVVPNFSWIQDVGDSLYPIVDQLRRAIGWVYQNADKFGGDADSLFLSGHSSGGHLAGVMLTTDWDSEAGLPADIIKGGLCCSGMFDMKPVRLSSRGDYVAFTDEMEYDMSPIRHVEKLRAPLIIAYGSYETPEFKRQSVEFAAIADNAGKSVKLILAEHYNHFEIIETLANPHGVLGQAVLEQMMTIRHSNRQAQLST
ncbi:MAG: alpha/beta hydrolase [Woeseia sp.]|nr:alpha/beta hydrolase [Woeseia sp.]